MEYNDNLHRVKLKHLPPFFISADQAAFKLRKNSSRRKPVVCCSLNQTQIPNTKQMNDAVVSAPASTQKRHQMKAETPLFPAVCVTPKRSQHTAKNEQI